MKTTIALILTFSASAGFAKGHDCSTYCIELDTSTSTINFIGRLNVVAGTGSKKTHKLLEKKCRSLTQWGTGVLVDSLDFRSRYDSDTYRVFYQGQWYGMSATELYGHSTYSYGRREHGVALCSSILISPAVAMSQEVKCGTISARNSK